MKKIFITGVSSGIGKELAIEYAKRGCFLGIAARRSDLLNEIHPLFDQLCVRRLVGRRLTMERR